MMMIIATVFGDCVQWRKRANLMKIVELRWTFILTTSPFVRNRRPTRKKRRWGITKRVILRTCFGLGAPHSIIMTKMYRNRSEMTKRGEIWRNSNAYEKEFCTNFQRGTSLQCSAQFCLAGLSDFVLLWEIFVYRHSNPNLFPRAQYIGPIFVE